ncbi:MAG: ferredoxin [Coprobacter sp.]|nr:ferredoxin [Coprobacter sp.]
MIIDERDSRKEFMLEVAKQMMTAARTAPKGKGIDIIEIVTLTDEDIDAVSTELVHLHEETGMKFLLRDSENIQSADAMLVIGTRHANQGLNCAYCGFKTCVEKPLSTPCAINTIDVGIAIGSACAKAADLRVDSRVMFSAGWAAERLGLLPDCHQCIAIPISASSKNPFFDRKPKEEKK